MELTQTILTTTKMENQKVISDKQLKLKIHQLWFEVQSLQFTDDKSLVVNVLNQLYNLEQKLNEKIEYSEINTI